MSQTRASYREIGGPNGLLANREPFTGNSMSGYRHADGSYDVFSYRTLVASYNAETGESWVSDNHWGQTTGRHLGLCRAWLPRVRSNAPEAIGGIGPGCKVEYDRPGELAADAPRTVYGYVREVYPLAGRVVVEPSYRYGTDREVLPREAVTLA